MPEPYVGEIRMFAGSFAPAGWMLCQGQTLAIAENDVLFTLIGTTYGGDGQETFNLPNLASRVPIHMGTKSGITYQIGEQAGTEQETLTAQQTPIHNHAMLVSTAAGGTNTPTNAVVAASPSVQLFIVDSPDTAMAASSIQPAGGSQPHENTQPFLCINFIISLFGVFPSQT